MIVAHVIQMKPMVLPVALGSMTSNVLRCNDGFEVRRLQLWRPSWCVFNNYHATLSYPGNQIFKSSENHWLFSSLWLGYDVLVFRVSKWCFEGVPELKTSASQASPVSYFSRYPRFHQLEEAQGANVPKMMQLFSCMLCYQEKSWEIMKISWSTPV